MRISRPLALAGAAALVAGLGVAASAENPKVHVMQVALPDGSVRQIRYTGDTPPRIVMVADPLAAAMPVGFAGFDRIAAAMDAQMAAMMRQASAMRQQAAAAGANGVQMTSAGAAPSGTRFSYVSTTTVNGKTCTTSVQQVSQGADKAPQLLRKVSGDGCGSAVQAPQGLTPTALPVAPTPPAAPKAPTVPRDTI